MYQFRVFSSMALPLDLMIFMLLAVGKDFPIYTNHQVPAFQLIDAEENSFPIFT